MYQCPRCGGNIHFDIDSQMMKCKYCNTMESPYNVEKETDGYEQEYFEATYFACPQCGGEVLTTDENMAAGFCSFCGASTILTSRISREKRPQKIIPFQVNKEQCKKLYIKRMRKAIFAPRGMKDEKGIESFRAIYMPYWKYNMSHRGSVILRGEKSHRSGDYIITDHYDLSANVDANYNGFYFDGSSSFYDNISEPLAPFMMQDSSDFTPSYLSGFYADSPDVPSEVYEQEAADKAEENSFECVKGQFVGYSVNDSESAKRKGKWFDTIFENVEGVMLPVWFMTYRKGNRVAYATVNGQTGKVVTDVPVDYMKYAFGSLLLAIPLFLLFNLLFTFRPVILLGLAGILACVTSILYMAEVNTIKKKEFNVGDKGIEAARGKLFKVKWKASDNGKKKMSKTDKWIVIMIVGIFVVMWSPFLFVMVGNIGLWVVILIITIISSIKGLKIHKMIPSTKGMFGFLSGMIAIIIGGIIVFINPVSDIYYYAGTLLVLLAVLITIIDIIRNYNILSTRELPQFRKQGGDDFA